MKIVCDNCATKYQIADEGQWQGLQNPLQEVWPRHRRQQGAGEAGAAGGDAGAAATLSSTAADAPAPPSDAVWHLVIDREQVGPMTVAEVQAKVNAGQADAETYGWREGFDDWLKLSAIEDFKSMFAGGGGGADPSLAGPAPRHRCPGEDGGAGAATIVSDGMSAPDMAAIQAAMASQKASARPGPGARSWRPLPLRWRQHRCRPASPIPSRHRRVVVARWMPSQVDDGSTQRKFSSVLAEQPVGAGRCQRRRWWWWRRRWRWWRRRKPAAGPGRLRQRPKRGLGPHRYPRYGGGNPGWTGGGGGMGPSMGKAPDIFGGSDAPPVFTPLAPAVLMPSSESEGTPKWVFALIGVAVVLGLGMIGVIVFLLQDSGKPTVATNGPGTTVATGRRRTAEPVRPRSAGSGDLGLLDRPAPSRPPAIPGASRTARPQLAATPESRPVARDSGSKSDGEKKSKGSKDKDKDKDSGSSKAGSGQGSPEPAAPPPAEEGSTAQEEGRSGLAAGYRKAQAAVASRRRTREEGPAGSALDECHPEHAQGVNVSSWGRRIRRGQRQADHQGRWQRCRAPVPKVARLVATVLL